MTELTNELRWRFSDLIDHGDEAEIERIVADSPEIFSTFAIAGLTWLQYACRYSSVAIVTQLLDLGFPINQLDSCSQSIALATASGRGDVELVKVLLERGAQANMSESNGNPLICCSSGHDRDTPKENYLEIARILIDHGIDTSARYDLSYGYGLDAKTFAWMWGRRDIARAIAEHEANRDPEKTEQLLVEAAERCEKRSWKGFAKRQRAAAAAGSGNRIPD